MINAIVCVILIVAVSAQQYGCNYPTCGGSGSGTPAYITTSAHASSCGQCVSYNGPIIVKNTGGSLSLTGCRGLKSIKNGYLQVYGTQAADLSGFYGLTDISGPCTNYPSVSVYDNSKLESFMDGFSQLTSTSCGIYFDNNNALYDGTWFPALETCNGDIEIKRHDKLTVIKGFDKLKRSKSIKISAAKCKTISGFSSLSYAENDLYFDMPSLLMLPGYDNLEKCGGSITFKGVGINYFSGFKKLKEISYGLSFTECNNLMSVDGFDATTYIGGNVVLENNKYLTTAGGFPSLTRVGGFYAKANKKLAEITMMKEVQRVDYDFSLEDAYDISMTPLVNLNYVGGKLKVKHSKVDGMYLCNMQKENGYLGGYEFEDNEGLSCASTLATLSYTNPPDSYCKFKKVKAKENKKNPGYWWWNGEKEYGAANMAGDELDIADQLAGLSADLSATSQEIHSRSLSVRADEYDDFNIPYMACGPVYCKAEKVKEGEGKFTCDNSVLTPGTKCQFTCDAGSYISGDAYIECDSRGHWKNSQKEKAKDMPMCSKISEKMPPEKEKEARGCPTGYTNLINNGDFEKGLKQWGQSSKTKEAEFYPAPGGKVKTPESNLMSCPTPSLGKLFAVSDTPHKNASMVLYQDFTVPAGVTKVSISLSTFCLSSAPYSKDLSYCRVDVVKGGFSDFWNPTNYQNNIVKQFKAPWATDAHTLMNNVLMFSPTSSDVTVTAGATYRLVFRADIYNRNVPDINFGVDNVAVCVPSNFCPAPPPPPPSLCGGSTANLIVNGDFYDGVNSWGIEFDSTTEGNWIYPTTGGDLVLPGPYGFTTPVTGKGYAVSAYKDKNEQHFTSFVMYQEFTVPDTVSAVTITYDVFCKTNKQFKDAGTMRIDAGPNQHCRVDLMQGGFGDWFAVAPSSNGVYANLLAPFTRNNFQTDSQTVSVTPGATYRLAFRAANNQGYLAMGVDNVRICLDAVNYGLTISAPSVLEGSQGMHDGIIVSVSIMAQQPAPPSPAPVKFQFMTSHITTTDNDFTPLQQTYTVTPGATGTSKFDYTIKINGDNVVELDETFKVKVVPVSSNLVLGSGLTGEAIAKIINDDTSTFALIPETWSMLEGSKLPANFFDFTITISHGIDTDVIMNVEPNVLDSASIDDFIPMLMVGRTVPARTTGSVWKETLPISPDNVVELDEYFFLDFSLGNTHGRSVVFAGGDVPTPQNHAECTIINDDTAHIVFKGPAVPEDVASGQFMFTVSLSHAIDTAVTYTIVQGPGGTTTDDDLMFPDMSTVVIPEDDIKNGMGVGGGMVTSVFNIAVFNDQVVELDEWFNLDIMFGDGMSAFGGRNVDVTSQSRFRGTILNDDTAFASVSSPVPGPEGSSFEFTITISHEVDTAGSGWLVTSDGTAKAGQDYQATILTTTLIPQAGTQIVMTVPSIQDSVTEANEVFFVDMYLNPLHNRAYKVVSPSRGVATIIDDDVTKTATQSSMSSMTCSKTPSTTSTASRSASTTLTSTCSHTSTASASGSASVTPRPSDSAQPSKSQGASTTPTAAPSSSQSHTCSSSPSVTSTNSASRTPSLSKSGTSSSTASVSASSVPSHTCSASSTSQPSQSSGASPSKTSTNTASASCHASASATSSSSLTPSTTRTAYPSTSNTASTSVSISTTSTATASVSESGSTTATRSASRSATSSPTISHSSTNTNTAAASPTPTSSFSASKSSGASASASSTESASSTKSSSSTNTASPSTTETATMSASVTAMPTNSPTSSKSVSGTPSGSRSPSTSFTSTATQTASSSATVSDSATSSVSFTRSMTPSEAASPPIPVSASSTPVSASASPVSATASSAATPSPYGGYQTFISCVPPDQTMGYSTTAPVVCTATNRLDCENFSWLHIYFDPDPVPVNTFRYTPFFPENVVTGTSVCSSDHFSVIFRPSSGSWMLMTRYQVNVTQSETVDENGLPFANGVSNVFYTTPAGAIDQITTGGAAAATPGMDASIWRWLGPVIGIIALALLALCIWCCLKHCRRKNKSNLAETTTNISSSASTRVLEDSAPSLQASNSFVADRAQDSSAYLRSSYSEKPKRPSPDFALYNQKKPQSQLDSDAAEGSVAAMATLRAWERAKNAPTHRGEGVEWEDIYDASGMHNAEGVVVDVEKRQKYSNSESLFKPDYSSLAGSKAGSGSLAGSVASVSGSGSNKSLSQTTKSGTGSKGSSST